MMTKTGIQLQTYHKGQEVGRTITAFRVPEKWLSIVVREWFDMDLDHFTGWYEYDHAEMIYEKAQDESVIYEEVHI